MTPSPPTASTRRGSPARPPAPAPRRTARSTPRPSPTRTSPTRASGPRRPPSSSRSLQLSYTVVTAANDGVVSRLGGRVGRSCSRGRCSGSSSPAGPTSSRTSRRRRPVRSVPGRRVDVDVDAYGGRKLEGRVESNLRRDRRALRAAPPRQRVRELREGGRARPGPDRLGEPSRRPPAPRRPLRERDGAHELTAAAPPRRRAARNGERARGPVRRTSRSRRRAAARTRAEARFLGRLSTASPRCRRE